MRFKYSLLYLILSIMIVVAAEVLHKANFSEFEAQRLVNRFGKYLSPRNFGDIIKYPPAAVEAIILISTLFQQGLGTEEIMEMLGQAEQQAVESLHDHFRREVSNLLQLQNQTCQLMRFTFEKLQDLMSNMVILTAKLVAAEEENQNLREENQACKTQLAQYKKLRNLI